MIIIDNNARKVMMVPKFLSRNCTSYKFLRIMMTRMTIINVIIL